LEWPGQTILCISQLYWTADVIRAMPTAPESLAKYIEQCVDELGEIVKLVRGNLSKQNRTTLGKIYCH
jgi:dynein heavy chain